MDFGLRRYSGLIPGTSSHFLYSYLLHASILARYLWNCTGGPLCACISHIMQHQDPLLPLQRSSRIRLILGDWLARVISTVLKEENSVRNITDCLLQGQLNKGFENKLARHFKKIETFTKKVFILIFMLTWKVT